MFNVYNVLVIAHEACSLALVGRRPLHLFCFVHSASCLHLLRQNLIQCHIFTDHTMRLSLSMNVLKIPRIHASVVM